MGIRIVSTLTLATAAAVLATSAGPAIGSGAHVSPTATAHTHRVGDNPTPDGKKGECYSVPTFPRVGEGIVSQNFESSLDAYDSRGGGDFPGKVCKLVKKVVANGIYFNGSGPASSVNVTFYKKGTTPGAVVADYNALSFTDAAGIFTVPVPKTKTSKGGWVSVQANMDFSAGGEWGWILDADQPGNPDVWENPGDGFGTGCTTWGTVLGCLGFSGDFTYALYKK